MTKNVLMLIASFILEGCGSGLCPLGASGQVCISSGSGGNSLTAIGVLDTAFNGTGIVNTDLASVNEGCNAVAIQSDGKIIAAGYSNTGSRDFALLRYNSDGSLDTTFNTTGIVTTPISAGGTDEALAVKIQSDGKILLSGYANSGADDIALARYHSNGSLDTTFNTTGKVTTSILANDYANAMALQPDGKIVVTGSADNDFYAARYHSNGSLDTNFNGTGSIVTSIFPAFDQSNAIAIQSDGKILIGGQGFNGANYDFALVRYHANGSLDTTFNTTGIVTTAIVTNDYIRQIILQPDGKILVGGQTSNGANLEMVVARYNTDGSLDTTFNTTGYRRTTLSTSTYGRAITLQSDGKILVGGATVTAGDGRFAVVRYQSDGTVDTTFGTAGSVTTDIVVGPGDDYITGIALQSDGKIVAAGTTSSLIFAVVRYR